jgi:hypothetical protein
LQAGELHPQTSREALKREKRERKRQVPIRKKDFQTNVPIAVSFRSTRHEDAESQFGDEVAFNTSQGKMYVSADAGNVIAQQLIELGVQPGELVQICKTQVAVPGRSKPSIRWVVSRPHAPAVGQQPNGTFSVPTGNIPGAGAVTPAPTATSQSPSNGNGNGTNSGNGNGHGYPPMPTTTAAAATWADRLLARTNALTDVFALALQHSSKHGQLVKSEDVRSLLQTVYISMSKNGGGHES